MSTIQEHLSTIRVHLGELSDEHAKHGNEFLAIVEAEKTIDEIETLFKQRLEKE